MNTQKTRCPYCSSMFAVSDAQLSIRNGYTRCGKCFQVFKADDHLIVDQPPIVETAVVPAIITKETFASEKQTLAADQLSTETQHNLSADAEDRPVANIETPQELAQASIAAEKLELAAEPLPVEKTELSVESLPIEEIKLAAEPFAAVQVELPAAPSPVEEIALAAKPLTVEKTETKVERSTAPNEAAIEDVFFDEALNTGDPITAPSRDIVISEIDSLEAISFDSSSKIAIEPVAKAQQLEIAQPTQPKTAAIAATISAPVAQVKEPEIAVAAPRISPLHVEDDIDAIVPAMSHTFEQEFNDLWLSATTEAPTVNHNELQEALTPESLIIHDSAADPEFNDSNISKDSVLHLGAVAAIAGASNSVINDDDLVSYLNKNSVPSAASSNRREYSEPDINILPSKKKKKQEIVTKPGNRVMERLSQPNFRFNVNFPAFFGRAILSLLLLALLAGQYIYFNFDRLAANPKYYPTMHKICASLGCNVPLVDISKIKMSQVLARRFPDSPNEATRFTALMTNDADESQPYPALRLLVLKDGKVLSGRILKPNEYLPNGFTALAKLPAKTPTNIQFVLKIPRENIAVFALDPVR